MENAMTMDGIIDQLYELGAYRTHKAEACREAANILYTLLDSGIHTPEEAKAFVRGSKEVARRYQAL